MSRGASRQQEGEVALLPEVDLREVNRLVYLLQYAAGGCWAIALYNTVAVRDRVVQVLRSRVAPVPVYEFAFAPEDGPRAYLQGIAPEERGHRAVVCLYNAAQAGPAFWGRLELEREALAALPHGLVFWLTPAEYKQAVRNAPHCWSLCS